MPSIELPDQLLSLHTAELKERNDSYIIEVPSRELQQGDLQDGEIYKIALLPALTPKTEPDQKQETSKPLFRKATFGRSKLRRSVNKVTELPRSNVATLSSSQKQRKAIRLLLKLRT